MQQVILNGFGRIGRLFARFYLQSKRKHFHLCAINDLQGQDIGQHLARYDSTYGYQDLQFEGIHWSQDSSLEKLLALFPQALVLDATGAFTDSKMAQRHLQHGACKVIISAPAKDDSFKTVCYGINHKRLNSSDKLISAASCTTGALAPIVDFFHKHNKLESLFFTTLHAATNDQRVQDSAHSDYRRARSVFGNLIPTKTGGRSALGKIFPELKIPIEGIAIRTPHAAVSLLDMTLTLSQSINSKALFALLEEDCRTRYLGLMRLEYAPLVSSDYIGERHSVVIDKSSLLINERHIKLLAWYDNEFGYTDKLFALTNYVTSELCKTR